MNTKTLHIGCSSYNTASWIGIFYPETIMKKEWFEYYSGRFKTYELNATFYRFPTLKSLQNWYDKTPEGFTFAVKAPKQITHFNKFVEVQQLVSDFYTVCKDGLQEKLGPVLFQLPPSFSYTPERLELIISTLHPDFTNVVEFRNESWWVPEVYEALTQARITFCSVNYPKLPTTLIGTTDIGYIRLHGNPKLFYSAYTPSALQELFQQILKMQQWKTVYIYFNNTASTAGIENAVAFQKIEKDHEMIPK